jgi:hypothetical protein
MTDFFISYTIADKAWAEWIGYVLEEEDYSVVLQAWDFRPGSNFVLEMQRAAAQATRTIMALSPEYLKSQFTAPEWAAAFADDPRGLDQKVVPVVVRPCEPHGLLKSLVHIDLTGLAEEVARQTLLSGVTSIRAKPIKRPAFPGAAQDSPHRAFPGDHVGLVATARPAPYIPKGLKAASDADKRRYMKNAFETIAAYFESALPALAATGGAVEVDFQREGVSDFMVEIFLGGKSVTACRIWRSDAPYGDGICYSEGRQHLGRNSYNEILSVTDEGGELRLASTMGGFGRAAEGVDLKRLREDQAAEYLWRRLVDRLER